MNREQVHSTAIESVGYHPATQTLEIEFTNGSVYQYRGVPDTLHKKLMSAPSKGKFHYNYIMRRFHFTRIR